MRNYGVRPHTVTLSLDFGPPGPAGRVAAGSRPLILAPGAESEASFEYRTSAAGMLGVHLSPHDSQLKHSVSFREIVCLGGLLPNDGQTAPYYLLLRPESPCRLGQRRQRQHNVATSTSLVIQ